MLPTNTLLLLLIRLFLGYIFFSAGVCKLTGGNFGQLIGPPWLEQGLAEYGLGLFAKVVAISQVICGLLLLSQRFAVLGAIMLVPMNVAILAVTVSMEWVGTPYINTAFLALNLLLLGMEYKKFSFLFRPTQSYTYNPGFSDTIGMNVYSWLAIGLGLATMLAAFNSLILTNVFALLTFAACTATIFKTGLLSRLEQAVLFLPFLAMVGVTFGHLHASMPLVFGGLLALESILVIFRLYLGLRSSKPTDTIVPSPTL